MSIAPKDVAQRYGVGEKWVRQLAREETVGHRSHDRWVWRDWEDPELARVLRRLADGRAHDEVLEWDLPISSKNQVTLPAAALRALRVKPGDKLLLMVKGHILELAPHPKSWADHYAGMAPGLYGATDDDVSAYLRESRGEWEPLKGAE